MNLLMSRNLTEKEIRLMLRSLQVIGFFYIVYWLIRFNFGVGLYFPLNPGNVFGAWIHFFIGLLPFSEFIYKALQKKTKKHFWLTVLTLLILYALGMVLAYSVADWSLCPVSVWTCWPQSWFF